MRWLLAGLGLPLAVAVGSNLDNLGVGFSYGLGGRRLALPQNVVVAVLTMACTAAAMHAGELGARWVPSSLTERGGGLIILAVGLVSAARALRQARSGAGAGQGGRGRRGLLWTGAVAVSYREALVLGVGLSLNNLAEGLGAGAAGISLPLTTALSGALSLLFLGFGAHAGRAGGLRALGRASPLAAAALLVAVGVKLCAP